MKNTEQNISTTPHHMPKWSRKPRNPQSTETRSLISLAIAARDEAAAHPTPKNKALREAAFMRVIVACEQMIHAYASRFASRELEQEDLTATATLGLIEALNRFDDSRSGGGWTGYVGAWMLWKLQQFTGIERKRVKLTRLEVEQIALLDGRRHANQWSYKTNMYLADLLESGVSDELELPRTRLDAKLHCDFM